MSASNSLYVVLVAIVRFLYAHLTDFLKSIVKHHLDHHLRRIVRTWCPSWEEFLLGPPKDRTGAAAENQQPLAEPIAEPPGHDARQPPHARRPNQDRRPKLSRADREIAQQQKHLVISRKPELRPRAENA